MRNYSSDFVLASPQVPPKLTLSKLLELRRSFVSSLLSEICRETMRPKILSVANGALREAETVLQLCDAAGGSFVVLDGEGEPPDLFRLDAPSSSCVRYISYPHGSIPSKENLGDFDFVYSLNLMNELDQRRAQAMVVSMLSLVRPGGSLFLSNFTSEFAEFAPAGFHRDEQEMADLVPDSGKHQLLGHAIWRDESRGILYLDVQKAELVGCGRTTRSGFLH